MDFLAKFPWPQFYDLLEEVYTSRRKSSEGGKDITPNEAQAILEKGRAFYVALEASINR